MRRWVFAFLLFVVPFQLVWGAAAPYCAHEAAASAKKHFGHHEHKHQAVTRSSRPRMLVRTPPVPSTLTARAAISAAPHACPWQSRLSGPYLTATP